MEGGALTGAHEFGLAEPPTPEAFVLLGDFNMVPGSPEYVLMTGETDYAEGRQIVAHHPVDAFTLVSEQPPGAATWIDDANPGRSSLIDYAFVQARPCRPREGVLDRSRCAWFRSSPGLAQTKAGRVKKG